MEGRLTRLSKLKVILEVVGWLADSGSVLMHEERSEWSDMPADGGYAWESRQVGWSENER